MSPDTLRVSLYRFLQRRVVGMLPPALPSRRNAVSQVVPSERKEGVPRVWFHAASVGELESLRTLIEKASEAGWEVALTHFSPSAESAVKKLAQELSGGSPVFAGYSPWEGAWGECIERFAPDLFVTAKYEAWPDLWWALESRDTPLLIVGPKARSSFRWVRRLTRFFGRALPRLALVIFEEADRAGLLEIFPRARVFPATDPRWDRVRQRALRPSARVEELKRRYSSAPKPWIVLGSVWPEDLQCVEAAIAESAQATYWLVPHKTDEAHVEQIERRLKKLGVSCARTTRKNSESSEIPKAIIVDEMGFLSELYAIGQGAYVGGGFGDGVHSTIEPSVHGLPIVAGSKNAEKFSEIAQLTSAGQLTLSHDAHTALTAFRALRDQAGSASNAFDLSGRFGGTARVWEIMDEIVSRRAAW